MNWFSCFNVNEVCVWSIVSSCLGEGGQNTSRGWLGDWTDESFSFEYWLIAMVCYPNWCMSALHVSYKLLHKNQQFNCQVVLYQFLTLWNPSNCLTWSSNSILIAIVCWNISFCRKHLLATLRLLESATLGTHHRTNIDI